MKKWLLSVIVLFILAYSGSVISAFGSIHIANATSLFKLPYAKGQSFVVTQGYNAPPTHIKKDANALDLTQNACEAYGKAVVAAASGTVRFFGQFGYNGGYGTELIIDHGNNIVSRYAHMIPGSIMIAAPGMPVRQGQAIGLVGDTGLVAGAACAAHPGTHLHFAVDRVGADGTFFAYDPEPISGYTNMTEGKWYLSDNDEELNNVATPIVANGVGVGSSSVSSSAPLSIKAVVPSGAVSAASVSVDENVTISPAQMLAATSAPSVAATSTIETASSSVATSSQSIASSSGVLFYQSDDSATSHASWYDDNWFDLGDGFSGTLNTLVLEGRVSDPDYLASQISLEEFKDKNYTAMVQEFPISGNAPFTYTMATTTFDGLSIPLKPYFYYRLTTLQDWQNRSVLLAGTTNTTTGTYMWDGFVPNVGRVESTSTFFPYMVMEGAFATSTIVSSPLTPPGNLAESFDEFGMQLNLSWSTSTDPEWPANPLRYEMNYSTSTELSDAGWGSIASIPLVAGNSYLVGIRALDDYGDISAPATTTWNFPQGFSPYVLSSEKSYVYQYFSVNATSTLQSVKLFTTNLQSGAPYVSSIVCSMQLFDNANASSLGVTQSDNNVGGRDCAGSPTFSFSSSPLILQPGHQYEWVFNVQTGNPSTGASVQFYGTGTNTAGGIFSDPSLVNAKFTLVGDSGTIFSN